MNATRTNTEAQLEVLSDALSAANYARRTVEMGDLSAEAVRAEIRTTNVLLDACIDCGMYHGEADHVGWAATRVAAWLCSGVEA